VAAKMRELGLVNVRILNFLGGMMTINFAEKEQHPVIPSFLSPPGAPSTLPS